MAALHIRDIDDTLVKKLKLEAAILGVTMKEYVTDRLWNGGDTLREVAEEREAIGVGKVQAKSERDGVLPVRGEGEVRVEERGSDAAVGVKVRVPAKDRKHTEDGLPRCKHGTKVGEYCGFCFGTVMKHMTKGE